MADTSLPSVLLLGWSDAPNSLRAAAAWVQEAPTQAWLPAPVEPGVLPAAVDVSVLEGALSTVSYAGLGQDSPAAPYVGRSGQAAVAVPAAPYIGSSQPPQAPGSQPAIAVPASPYIGSAAHDSAAEYEAQHEGHHVVPGSRFAEVSDETAQALDADAEENAHVVELTAPAPAAESGNAAAAADADEADGLPLTASAEFVVPVSALHDRIIRHARHAVRRARTKPFDVIFAPDWRAWLAAVEIRQLTRRPLVLRVEQILTDHADTSDIGWVEALERMAVRHAELLLVPDEALAKRLREQYELRPERLRVLPADAAPDFAASLILDVRFAEEV